MNRKYGLVILVIQSALLGACVSSPAPNEEEKTAAVNQCMEPRPNVCTMDYRPVCGTLNDESEAEYSNGCGACADSNVVSWVEGSCK